MAALPYSYDQSIPRWGQLSHDVAICANVIVCILQMLNPDSICPAAQQEIKSYLKSATVKNFFVKHKKLVKFVEQKSGMTFDHHWVGRDLFNALEIQKTDFGLKLPEWVNDTVYNDLQLFLQMSFIFDAATEKLRRLRTGMSVV